MHKRWIGCILSLTRPLTSGEWVTKDLASLLRKCGEKRDLAQGKLLHSRMEAMGLSRRTVFGNLLVQMYGRCGRVEESRRVFEGIAQRNAFSWGMMLTAFAHNGHYKEVLRLHQVMQSEGVGADKIVLSMVLRACSSLGDLCRGRLVHQQALASGIPIDLIMETTLLGLYSQCGEVAEAIRVFRGMREKDLVTWSSIIAAFAKGGQSQMAITLYREMIQEGVRPDGFIFTSVVTACNTLRDANCVHEQITILGIACDDVLNTCILQMYSRVGSIADARRVFERMQHRAVGTWTSMIAADAAAGDFARAMDTFDAMSSSPDAFTYATVLDACSACRDHQRGTKVHARLLAEPAAVSKDLQVQTALLDMYSKCGRTEEAMAVFEAMEQRDSVAWNAMIDGYAQGGKLEEAVQLLSRMDMEGIQATEASFASVIAACASQGTIVIARQIQSSINFCDSVVVQNALLNMLAKCGGIAEAGRAFGAMTARSLVSWNTMLIAFAQHGEFEAAIELRRGMDLDGVVPDRGTLACVATACAHSGSLDGGLSCFLSIVADRGIDLSPDHYAITLDLLARAGKLEEAEEILERMPFEPDATVLRILLSSCKVHGDVERGSRVAAKLERDHPQDTGSYLILSNLYSSSLDDGSHQQLVSKRGSA